uniref:Ig-like domain-containing protein n=1 Tax=Astyanax mexicanus TaxID=7994 RepID=A0A3B1ILZ0_ASTMX
MTRKNPPALTFLSLLESPKHGYSVPPVINSSTKSYDVAVDGSVTLQCQSEGYPTPSVIWHKDGQPLTESVRQRVLSSGSLHIVFTQPGDTGRYTCTAANVAGSSSVEMSLTVLNSQPSLFSGSPIFTVEPFDTVVDSGSTVVLNCQAQGEPTPVIEWASQGRPLLSNDRITILANGSLRISSAQKEDTAEYACIARNLMGSALDYDYLHIYMCVCVCVGVFL